MASRAPLSGEGAAPERSDIARAYPGFVSAPSIDWQEWLRRWDAQQQLHIPHREDRFAAITDALGAVSGPSPRVLDIGCGPGSLSVRVLQRIPEAELVAIDTDPVLLAIGRGALGDRRRIHFVEADLRSDWVSELPLPPPFDAAVSTTALHWLELPELVRFYATLAELIRPGGVFLNGDRLDFGHDQVTIGEVAQSVRSAQSAPPPPDAEDWNVWWRAVDREPTLADAAAERRRRGHDHPHREAPQPFGFHKSALLAAGFSEVGTIWQRLADRVLIAIR
jgi:SAM-dependent methyltransferase